MITHANQDNRRKYEISCLYGDKTPGAIIWFEVLPLHYVRQIAERCNGMTELCREVALWSATGWENVFDQDGNALPFSRELWENIMSHNIEEYENIVAFSYFDLVPDEVCALFEYINDPVWKRIENKISPHFPRETGIETETTMVSA